MTVAAWNTLQQNRAARLTRAGRELGSDLAG
jgi:hypothetical protein